MSRRTISGFKVGPDVVQHLLPHRAPLLLVDTVDGYTPGPPPRLSASRFISSNEPVFAGHFPDLHLWPGIYTIEGMGQACQILTVLETLRQQWREQGRDPEEPLELLRNLELGYKLAPGFLPEREGMIVGALGRIDRLGVSAAMEMKLTHPVFAGQRLTYEVQLESMLTRFARFEVEAYVEGRLVAQGILTVAALDAKLPRALRGG